MKATDAVALIRRKRDGLRLDAGQLRVIAEGIASGAWSDAQIAAFAMAVAWRDMDAKETRALTLALCDSGTRLRWDGLPGPILDKHSTGGVGDCVSLLLAPMLAACGAYLPMISGRGLGHTGGTLDKLESIPGYTINPDDSRMRAVLADAGCVIVGQSEVLAPADRRLYAVRDVTATVDVPSLMVASILSKKLAGGAQALVLDVKVGSGAQLPDQASAEALADRLIGAAECGGMQVRAAISDMDQVLGSNAGNALELREVLDVLSGEGGSARLRELTLALSAELLQMGGLAADEAEARGKLMQALDTGAAAERFERMVAGLGGSHSLYANADAWLPRAPVQQVIVAKRPGFVGQIDVRALGQIVVALGGGRSEAGQAIDHAVGLSAVLGRGVAVCAGQPLAIVHARTRAMAESAADSVLCAFRVDDQPPPENPLLRWHRAGALA
ncbi:MAG: thymidine phosphorylase [Xanthomonadales bacterium]|nr:thymidine phosphorylase [Xanthomonadales bacterium]